MKEKELFEIADKIFSGEIFCNLNIEPADYEKHLPLVFTPLGKKPIGKLDIEPHFVYAYMEDMIDDNINEKYPSFAAIYFLNELQSDIVINRLKENGFIR